MVPAVSSSAGLFYCVTIQLAGFHALYLKELLAWVKATSGVSEDDEEDGGPLDDYVANASRN